VNLVTDARTIIDSRFDKIPDQSAWKLSKDAPIIYCCDHRRRGPHNSRNLYTKADTSNPFRVAGMSSSIRFGKISVRNYHTIFFDAQKNLGSTEITVTIFKKNLLPLQFILSHLQISQESLAYLSNKSFLR
jgi:phosphoserine aminotransferase